MAFQTITLTRVHRTDKDKQGNPLINSNGKPYTRLGVQATEYGQQWISGFSNRENSGWKVGDKVQVNIEKNGDYLNLKPVDPLEVVKSQLDRIEKGVNELIKVQFIQASDIPAPQVQDEEITVEDIPF